MVSFLSAKIQFNRWLFFTSKKSPDTRSENENVQNLTKHSMSKLQDTYQGPSFNGPVCCKLVNVKVLRHLAPSALNLGGERKKNELSTFPIAIYLHSCKWFRLKGQSADSESSNI